MSHILDGKTITAIEIASDKEALRFHVEGGEPIVARCDADCCSHTFIETVEMPALGLPAKVLKADDLDIEKDDISNDEHECLRFYGFKIETDKGDIVIDYRNSSNGYYGGNLYWPKEDPKEYSHFYGGVHGQNVSNEEWKSL